jgi:hypothetical protein
MSKLRPAAVGEGARMHAEGIGALRDTSATRVVVSTLGVLVGLAGIEHGFFEVLQGNAAPSGMMIEAIGPAQKFWEYGTERALTIIPNLLVTGILAMVVGLLVVIWAAAFVHGKYGALVLMLLSLILFLVGGGFGPIFLAILASLTATRINKPLTWWRTHLSPSLRRFLAKLWPWSLIFFVFVFLIAVEIAIFGWPLVPSYDAGTANKMLFNIAYAMLGVMFLSVVAAFAYDIQKQGEIEGGKKEDPIR